MSCPSGNTAFTPRSRRRIAGPQPPSTICPHCRLYLKANDSTHARAQLNLDADLKSEINSNLVNLDALALTVVIEHETSSGTIVSDTIVYDLETAIGDLCNINVSGPIDVDIVLPESPSQNPPIHIEASITGVISGSSPQSYELDLSNQLLFQWDE